MSIFSGDIVWVNGPFKAAKADKTIFVQEGLRAALCDDECIEVDNGNKGDDKLKPPDVAQTRRDKNQKGCARAKIENINSYFKKFSVLDDVFRHDAETKHQQCFFAVAVITQLRFEIEGHLYVRYD